MTHTATSARDAVLGTINTAWLASGVTSSIGLLWDDVQVAEEDLGATRHDARGNPLPYARAVLRTLASAQETIGPDSVASYLTDALLTVQIFTPPGDGNELADSIVEVLKAAVRGKQVGELWFFGAVPNERGLDKQWYRTDFQVNVRYVER